MLELLGNGYVIDHCIAVFQKKNEEKLFKAYVAESLRTIAAMTGRSAGMKVEMADYRELAGWTKTDDRTGDEIAADIIKRAGLRMSDGTI